MRRAAAHTAIMANYKLLYDKLAPEPHRVLWHAAKLVGNGYFKEDQERRAAEKGVDIEKAGVGPLFIGDSDAVQHDMEPTADFLTGELTPRDMLYQVYGGIYMGFQPTSMFVDVSICVSEKIRRKARRKAVATELYPKPWD